MVVKLQSVTYVVVCSIGESSKNCICLFFLFLAHATITIMTMISSRITIMKPSTDAAISGSDNDSATTGALVAVRSLVGLGLGGDLVETGMRLGLGVDLVETGMR